MLLFAKRSDKGYRMLTAVLPLKPQTSAASLIPNDPPNNPLCSQKTPKKDDKLRISTQKTFCSDARQTARSFRLGAGAALLRSHAL